MKSHELARKLLELPDIEVGTNDGEIIGVEQSTYDNESGTHEYINLEVDTDL